MLLAFLFSIMMERKETVWNTAHATARVEVEAHEDDTNSSGPEVVAFSFASFA